MRALILVADADPFNLRLLAELCSMQGYEVATAGDGGAVLDAVARQQPDLVLMDIGLPVMDGLQILRILKADADLSRVPIVLATSEGDEDARRLGVELGADDYVGKPYRSFEVQQRLRTVLRLRAAESSGPAAAPERFDIADPITGAGTSGQLHISLDYEFTRAARYKHPLGCIAVRCTNHAHIADSAQRVLVPMTSALRGCIRGVDHLFRSASDELTILLPETDARGCAIVVERVRATMARRELFEADLDPRPRICAAFACYPQVKVEDGEALWRAAAAALGSERA